MNKSEFKHICYKSIEGIGCEIIETKPLALLKSIESSIGKKTEIRYGNIISDNLNITPRELESDLNINRYIQLYK